MSNKQETLKTKANNHINKTRQKSNQIKMRKTKNKNKQKQKQQIKNSKQK